MRTPLLFLATIVLAISPCWALPQQTADFIKSVGLDPNSADVVAADQEGTIKTTYNGDEETFSLEALALKKRGNAVRSFVVSRKVARELNANFKGFKIPAGGISGLDDLYLTPSERLLLAAKSKEPRSPN